MEATSIPRVTENATNNDYHFVDSTVYNVTNKYSAEEIKAYLDYTNSAKIIWKYTPGFLICIGIIGNTLSALVMTRPALQRTVTSLFFTVLAVVDTFCLLTGLLRYWIMGLTNHDVRNNSDVSCKLHTFMVYWSVDFSGWILVLVSAERCFAANIPHIYKQVCTRTKAAVSLVICAVVLALINCHYLFSIELRSKVSNTTGEVTVSCVDKPQFEHYQSMIFPWIDLIFYCMGPFFCILCCNISIAVRVFRSKMATDQKSKNHLSSMTGILISVSVFYVTCTAPIAVYLIGQNFWFDDPDLVFIGKMDLYFAVAAIMSYLNNSMNFFLYCISGPSFRRELMKMFSCLKPSSLSRENSVSGL